jgi:hypothetical protein
MPEHLHEWKTAWNTDNQHSQSEISAAFAGVQPIPIGGETTPPFQTIFIFQNPSTAKTQMLYNTTLTYVLQILSSLPAADPQLQSSKNNHHLTPSTNTYAEMDTGSLKIAHLDVRTAFQTLGRRGSLDGNGRCSYLM